MTPPDFDELAGRLLDGEPSPDEAAELLRLVRDDPERLAELRRQFETAELLALAVDPLRGSPLFVEATLSRAAEARPAADRPAAPARRRLGWAAVALTVAGLAWWLAATRVPRGGGFVARVEALQGGVRWIGDGGRIKDDVKAGDELGGGTLEAVGADSWATLVFADGTAATVSGPALVTVSDFGQKELSLRQGNLFASVSPQPAGRPLLVHTRTARLEVLGTRLDVAAGDDATRLYVDEGRVRVTRLVDGTAAEVPARHQVVATADGRVGLTPAERARPVNHWHSRLAASVGKPLPAEQDRGPRLRAIPIVLSRPREGTLAVFVAAFGAAQATGVPQADVPPVALEAGGRFRVRGWLGAAGRVGFGATVKRPGGSFGGKFETQLAPRELAAGPFDRTVAVEALRPLQSAFAGNPVGAELEDCYVFTVNDDAGLEVAEVELIPAGRP